MMATGGGIGTKIVLNDLELTVIRILEIDSAVSGVTGKEFGLPLTKTGTGNKLVIQKD